MVIAPPTHIENHLLGFYPFLGFAGADVIADRVYTTTKLGLEKHLIDLFGDAGLEYADESSGTETHAANNGNGKEDMAVAVGGTSTQQSTTTTPTPDHLEWSPEAQAMLKKVPFFVRRKAQRNTEKFAQEHGYTNITPDVLRAAKEEIGG